MFKLYKGLDLSSRLYTTSYVFNDSKDFLLQVNQHQANDCQSEFPYFVPPRFKTVHCANCLKMLLGTAKLSVL